MDKVDENFFRRLDESFLVSEEKNYKHPIFSKENEEKEYYEKFPTIYHLRKYLSDNQEKADVRLIYLALAHMIKYRGNFLIEGDIDVTNTSIIETFKNFLELFNERYENEEDLIIDDNKIYLLEMTLKEKVSRTKKLENILKYFEGRKKNDIFGQFLTLIVGNQANFKKEFNLEEDAKIKFTDENYEEDLNSLIDLISDEYADLFYSAKAVYNAIELSSFLNSNDKDTKAKLSSQMIKMYEDHKEQLEKYKNFIKVNLPDKYDETFRDESKNGYAGYIEGKTNQEDFYKYVKSQVKGTIEEKYFLDLIEKEDFLRKQRSFYNGVIPYQIHLKEMEAILNNQKKYYSFLKENEEKIKSLLTFRIPYYVGPLANGESRFAWIERKSNEKIKPWNFDEVVNRDQSAIKFIERLTSNDLYLPDKKVLPKKSITYQKFAIFNELTKVKYTDERVKNAEFTHEEKINIFEDLFKKNKSVSKKLLIKYLENNYQSDNPKITGIEDKFNANFSTYIDLAKIDGMKSIIDNPEYEDEVEEIILILTVFEDRKMRFRQLSKFDNILSDKAIKDLSKMHYTGWGKLSKELINGIRDKDTKKTILDYLINDDGNNRNFMQLISDKNLSFKEIIREAQIVDVNKSLSEIVEDIPGSPAIKKGILCSFKIVQEIINIMGYKPKNITIEMARENQTTDSGKRKSKQRVNKIKDSLKELGSSLLKENPINNDEELKNNRLYLYYMQNGKDMYTGSDLDINKLSSYDIDHIIPRSFITDNSFDNIVLTSQDSNRGKLDDVPSIDVVNKMEYFWRTLLKSGCISQRKYNNLTKSIKGGLKQEDKDKFINRQLVETRQITKHIAEILNSYLNKEESEKRTNIILLKARLVSDFRKNFEIYKIRELNDIHHAHDAYLNAVVATKLLEINPRLSPKFVYGKFIYKSKKIENKATKEKLFMTNLINNFNEDILVDKETGEVVWDRNEEISIIKKVLSSKQVNVVKKTEERKGMLFKETINKKSETGSRIPLKDGLEPKYYGGYIEEKYAYYIFIKYTNSKSKQIKKIVGISILDKKEYEDKPLNYLEKLGYKNPIVIAKLMNYTLFEFKDGTKRLITGANKFEDNNIGELQKANQLILPNKYVKYLYNLKQLGDINNTESLEFIEKNKNLSYELITYILNFSRKYIKADKNIDKIKSLYENMKNANKIDYDELAESFISLLRFTAFGAPSDFKFFGEIIPRARYKSLGDLSNSEIIYQSYTGLYETRIDLEKY